MGRPRSYDEDVVLDQVMTLFWARGFEATSMSDLMGATGLGKGSLYKGFGDKQQLFVAALERYLQRGRERLAACFAEADTGFGGLRLWLLENAEPSTANGLRRGCLAVNTAIELAPHEPAVRRVLRDHERRMEKVYQRCIRRGLDDGSLRASLDPADTARWITTIIYGLQVRTKLGMTRAQARQTVAHALDALAPTEGTTS